jgi:hypothetical protein
MFQSFPDVAMFLLSLIFRENKRGCRIISAPVSYLLGPKLKYRVEDWLTSLRYFVSFFSPSKQVSW